MEQIEKFLIYIRYELNHSAHTVLSYGGDLEQFADFMGGAFSPEAVTADDVRAWVYDLSARRKLSVRTVRRKVQSLRAFYRFLLKRGEVGQSPVDDVPMAKLPRPLPVFVREAKMDEVLDAGFDRADFTQVRDRLIVAMLYETGIRRSELTGLSDADVDTSACELKVHGKRNKDRIVPFCEELRELVELYRPLRSAVAPAGEKAFFLTAKGRPAYAELVYRVVCAALSGATGGRRSPHVLRHSYASAMLNNGAGINTVKELLGHESLAATQIYTHITYKELRNNYEHAHPRALKKGG